MRTCNPNMRMSALTKVEMSSCVTRLPSEGGQHGRRGHGAYECAGVEAGACDSASDGQGLAAAGGRRGLGAADAPGAAADPAGPGRRRRGARASESRQALEPTAFARAEGPGAPAVCAALS